LANINLQVDMTATSVRPGNCHAAPGLSKAFAAPGRRRAGDVGVRGRPVHGMSSMKLRAQPHAALSGTATVPGDKSVSHRCLMFAALASGTSRISGLLEGEDVLATAGALRAMGVELAREHDGGWRVEGRGADGLAEPEDVLDLGNAGTGARLLMGILAGQPFTSVLSGDASLRRRPMRRVTEPLGLMGAAFAGRSGGRLPLAVTGRRPLRAIDYASPVASAQVKSAVLLAGLFADGTTTVREPLPSRDHTERMLRAMGAEVAVEDLPDGARAASVRGGASLAAQSLVVPGDPSSAAFPTVAALITPGSALRLGGVATNSLRAGLYTTLREMGARIRLTNERTAGGEPVADLEIEASDLGGVEVPPERAPSMIDEYPVLAVAAAFARGRTVMRGLAELRVKESDRLATMAHGLAACSVRVRVEGDDLIVEGGGPPAGGAAIDAHLDHRIAMSFLVLGGRAREPVTVEGAETIETSFPGFRGLMNGLGCRIEPAEVS
jgi:3-phosphoshikimate 1-carboxyvinyltransferase